MIHTIESTAHSVLRAGSVRVSRWLAAPADRVFSAWLDVEDAGAFLFALPGSDTVCSEIDARVGGKFRIVRRGRGGEIEYSGEYLELERPYRLVFSLFVDKHAQRDDRVVVELGAVGESSLLVLTHEHSSSSQQESTRIQTNWAAGLESLATLCCGWNSRGTLPWLGPWAFVCLDAGAS